MNKRLIILILLLAIPTFGLMLRSGVYTMHDFHLFRQFEFDKCMGEKVLPCRWAPDSSLGYGQPMFNYYGQLSYWVGTLFRWSGLSVLSSVKGVFILSLVASAVAMFALARNYWGDRGAVLSALLYMYAPYRAVDVWVRGALPEALGFVFFPLIWLAVDKYLQTQKYKYLFWLVMLTSGLIVTHNLSALMFAPFIGIWVIFRLSQKWSRSRLEDLVCAGFATLLLSAWYLLPVIFENQLITLTDVVAGYYTYQLHFVTLKQLFLSNFWGYGGSIWGPNDGLSFAVGYLQWQLPLIAGLVILVTGKARKYFHWLVITGLAVGALWLTHGKSEIVWKLIPPMTYIQFPWRFLTLGVFLLSLSAGVWAELVSKCLVIGGIILLAILLNVGFYRPDIWLAVNDAQYFSGASWDQQRSSAISDYWPKSASKLPADFAPNQPVFIIGSGKVLTQNKGAHQAVYEIQVNTDYAKVRFPIVYFPNWQSPETDIFPDGDLGLVTARIEKGHHFIHLNFVDTKVRQLGNWVSGLALIGLFVWSKKYVRN